MQGARCPAVSTCRKPSAWLHTPSASQPALRLAVHQQPRVLSLASSRSSSQAVDMAADMPTTTTSAQQQAGSSIQWWQAGLLSALVLASSVSASALQPLAAAATQDTWTGPARVVDGDTLYIGEQKFRLYGVDAPEKAQACLNPIGQSYMCGLVSKDALAQKVGTQANVQAAVIQEGKCVPTATLAQTVQCKTKQTDQYGRSVAVCSLLGPFGAQDLNKWLVENGYAVAYREYGKDYIPDEEGAKAARRNLWAGAFEYPAQWRKEEKAKLPHPPLTPSMPSLPGFPSLPGLPTMPSLPELPVPLPGAPLVPQLASSQVTSVTTTSTTTGAGLPDTCGKGVLPIKGNINSKGDKIFHVPGGPYYDKVLVEVEKGEAYFCSEADAIKAGYRAVGGNNANSAAAKAK